MPQKKIRRKKALGKYIVVDPCICHGEPTFKGTRKLVRDCLEMAAQGFTVDELANRSALPREAIVEALQLAAGVFQQHDKGAAYIRRLLRHPQFRTHAQRLGKIIKVIRQRIEFWEVGRSVKSIVAWE